MTLWTVEFAFYLFKRISLELHNDRWNRPRSLYYEISADETSIHPCTDKKKKEKKSIVSQAAKCVHSLSDQSLHFYSLNALFS